MLFDLDGVLIDSCEVHVRSWIEVFRPYGVELEPEWLNLQEGRRSMEIARAIVAEHNLRIDEAELSQLIERKRAFYRAHAPHGMRPDARIAVEELKNRGYAVGLVSGSVRDNMSSVLETKEQELFDVLITAEDYSRGKPDPEPYLIACQRLGLEPQSCIAVENAPLGIDSAKAAGMRVVALTSTLTEDKLRKAEEKIDGLTALPQMLGTPCVSPLRGRRGEKGIKGGGASS